ncbi:hypothetical protein [Kyrpidia spormannii]|uniref:hypothetical protein n=1 Tax=Kyrpidia spormannii TaxID=2055160 RepID=UPI00207B73CE|nr:hypothetical protein [Kyrpidia spormannii]
MAKALGTGIGKVGFQEIEIAGEAGGPEVRLSGKAAEVAGGVGLSNGTCPFLTAGKRRWHLLWQKVWDIGKSTDGSGGDGSRGDRWPRLSRMEERGPGILVHKCGPGRIYL